MSALVIDAITRKDLGKGEVRRLRRTGQAPGVIYGGESDPISIKFRHDDLLHSLENETFYSSVLNLKLDGKSEKVILRDIQHHPAKAQILHADFQRVSAKSEITMSVPMHYINTEIAAGIKKGGVVDVLFNEVLVRCLAKDLPEAIEVDLINMEIGDSVSLSDIVLPKGVKLSLFVGISEDEITAHDQVIVAIHEAKVTTEDETEAVADDTMTEEATEKSDDNTTE